MVIFEHKNSKIQIQCNSLLYFLKTSLNLLEKRIIQEYVVKIHHSLYPIIENNELIVTFDEKGETSDWFKYINSYYGGADLFCESEYYLDLIKEEQEKI